MEIYTFILILQSIVLCRITSAFCIYIVKLSFKLTCMRKFFLSFLTCLMALSVSAAGLTKQSASVRSMARPAANTASLQTNNVLLSLYDDKSSKVPNFYLIFAQNENAKYDSNTGSISAPAGTFTLVLDLYNNAPDDGLYLPAGTYNRFDSAEAEQTFGYSSDWSMLNYYDENGQQYSTLLTDPIEVTRDEATGRYTIKTLVEFSDGVVEVSFNGPLTFGSSTERPTVYPQITRDLNLNLNKGGISYYQGVTDISSQGVSYLDLYDVEFDEGGRMNSDGFNLCMMIAHKRFTKRADYAVCPATYSNSNTLARDTWYPAREIDYMGFVMPFGSYLRELKTVNGEREYTYAYLKTGTFIIEDNGDGTYKGTLDAVTTLGYSVKATWSGSIALNTDNATFQATVSDLTDDVEFDFSPLDKGRIFHSGIKGGCRTLTIDLGSPSGRDPGVNYGGDIFRMEFLVDQKHHLLEPGLYTVVPRRWNSNELVAGGTYEPGSLNKGYFDGNGALVGTRYAHFRTGSYCVCDVAAPAESGTVRVETSDYINYTFDIDLMDDAGFKMTGLWNNKPIEYWYDPEAVKAEIGSGVSIIADENSAVKAVIEGENLFIINAGNAPVAIYAVDGRQIISTTADQVIPVDSLGKGVFIISTNNTTLKIRL